MTVDELIEAIEGTALSKTISDVSWIIPGVQTVHILAIAVVLSSALVLDLRIFGLLGRSETVAAVSRRYLPWLWSAVLVLVLTGILLVMGEPGRTLNNEVFGLKMALLVVAILATLTIQLPLRRDEAFWSANGGRRLASSSLAVTSVLLWTGIVFAGRWIAYVSE